MENDNPIPHLVEPEMEQSLIQIPFEQYLKECGWGLYSKFIVGLICFVNYAQGIMFVAIPWALALSTCDQMFIPKSVALKVVTSVLIGKLIGKCFIGMVIDRYGRKRYLSISLIFIFMSSFFSAFAYNAIILVGAMLFLGIGLEINNVILELMMCEILPQEQRGFYMSLRSFFWTLGYLATSGFTILLETKTFLKNDHSEPRLPPWRVMFVSCGGINIFIACACALLEESPRYYLSMGKSFLAFLILKQLYATNTSMHAESFKVKEIDIKPCIKLYQFVYREPTSTFSVWYKLSWRLKKAIKMTFSKRFRKLTWLLVFIRIPIAASSVFGLNLLFAKQTAGSGFKTSSEYPNTHPKNFFDFLSPKLGSFDFFYPVLYAKNISDYNESPQTISVNEQFTTCGDNEPNKVFHSQFLILASGIVLGALLVMAVIENFGRKWLIFSGLLLATLITICLVFLEQNYYGYTALTFLLIMVNTILWIVVSILTVESYPTTLRGSVQAVTSLPGLLTQIFFINLIHLDAKIFFLILGVAYFCLSFFCFFIEDLKQKPMVE